MNKQQFSNFHHEKGMSTLVIVLLLLFVATLVTLYTANTAIREQQVSANQYRADQALSAANAGLDYATAYYFKYTGPDAVVNGDLTDFSGDGLIDVLTVPTLSGNGQTVFAEVTVTDADGLTDAVNGAFNGPHTITAVGFSDDRSATRTIQVQVDAFGIVPGSGLPGFPLVAKGVVAGGGNFAVINRFSNATIWTGAATANIGSAETYVREVAQDVDTGEWYEPSLTREQMISIDGSPRPDFVLNASYSKSGLNSDVIDNDDNLRNISGDEFFRNFLLEDKQTLEAIAKGNGQWFSSADTNFNWIDLVGLRGLVWIDVPPNGEWAQQGSQMQQIGTEKYPLTLIINGNFKATGGGSPAIRIVGLLYVIGDTVLSANFAIQGSVIIEGDANNSSGTPTIVYDEALYDGSLGVPPGAIMAVVPGTWKDW